MASGLNGPGRLRSGGVRDFILGMSYVDSQGRLVHGGGRVVKNAAGFDLPKLMTGSLGSLGILTELTFKVFPRPEAFTTNHVEFPSWEAALQMLARLGAVSLDLDALDLLPSTRGVSALVRLFGHVSVLQAKADRLRQVTGGVELLDSKAEEEVWRSAREFEWVPSGWSLIKIPITPSKIPAWELALENSPALQASLRRYSGAGQVCWLSAQAEIGQIDGLLAAHGLAGLVVLGQAGDVL